VKPGHTVEIEQLAEEAFLGRLECLNLTRGPKPFKPGTKTSLKNQTNELARIVVLDYNLKVIRM